METKTQELADLAPGVRCSRRAGLWMIVLEPATLEAEAWKRTEQSLRGLVREASHGVVIDCRQLPKGAFEKTGALFYDLLILGRRQIPRVEICVVGRADQSVGDSKVFVAPARFEKVDAAVSFLGAREKNVGRFSSRISGVSEKPLDYEKRRPPSLAARVARVAGVVIVLGFTVCLVAYSAIESFKKSPVRRPLAFRELGRSNLGARLAVYGSIGFVATGESQRDAGAAIVLWPAKATPHKIALKAEDVFQNRHLMKSDRIAYTMADEAGEYVFTRRILADDREGSYCLLVLSAHRVRVEPHQAKVVDQLAKYFDSPEELLGEHEYRFEQLTLDAFDPSEYNILFGENELRPVKQPLTAGSRPESLQPNP